jgi:hypothetical protein
MTKAEIKDQVGKFGIICGGEIGFKKTVAGWVREIDGAGNIYFYDNEDIGHIFPLKQIDTFEPREFVIIKEKPIDTMAAKKKTPKTNTEQQYKVFFTENGIEDYFIVEGESADKAYKTAKDVLLQRGLDYEKNNVSSQRIR